MTRTQLILLAAGGSAALLIGAWTFQYFGYAPCQMCIWQRYPHGVAVVLGVIAILVPLAILPWLGAVAAFVTGAIGVFHTGAEKGWWEGITSCAGAGNITEFKVGDLLNPNVQVGPPLVKCDEVAFEFLTLSMASWNALISFALVAVWIMAARTAR